MQQLGTNFSRLQGQQTFWLWPLIKTGPVKGNFLIALMKDLKYSFAKKTLNIWSEFVGLSELIVVFYGPICLVFSHHPLVNIF